MDGTGRRLEGDRAAAKGRVLTGLGRQARLLLGAAALTVAASLAGAASFPVPPLTDPVMDMAGLVTPEAKAALDQALRRLSDSGGSQIAVLTVESLGGLPIEQASLAVTDQWKLGTKKGDNGVLLLVARQERTVRIEVGQGLEGALTDAYSRRIIADVITPAFRGDDFTGGVLRGVQAIAGYTDPGVDLGLGQTAAEAPTGEDEGFSFWGALVLLLFFPLLFFLLHPVGYGRRRGGHWGGGSYRGGGGYSGGGGGFSGGGSSGRW